MNPSELLQHPARKPATVGQALLPGQRVGGFEILQVIGLTSFGVLYLGRKLADGSTAAIKEYLPSMLATRMRSGQVDVTDPAHLQAYQRGLQAFLAEALTLSQFDHPHLLRVLAVWEAHGTAYRSMPYLGGNTLLAWRSRTAEPASQAQVQTLLAGLLSALQALHQAGLAHGKVEPLNIYLGTDVQPVLMDFEAVHQAIRSDLQRPYVDAYADAARVQDLTAADLHAVAAVLHFAISGDWTPHEASAPTSALSDVLSRLKDRAWALQYQPEFLAAIDALLECPAAKRPTTITEFRALFDSISGAEPGAQDGTPIAPAEKPLWRLKQGPLPASPPARQLSSSESVLALLAEFDRPSPDAQDIEPFQPPELPTLTEEAEPALPPLRANPFDDIENHDPLPLLSTAESDDKPVAHASLPRIPYRNPWRQRLMVIAGMTVVLVAAIGALGWQLFG